MSNMPGPGYGHNKSFMAWLLAGAIALVLSLLGDHLADELYLFFALPAAWIAGLFFNVSPVIDEKGLIVIPFGHSSIQVTPDCSAYGFFCIVTAIFVVFYRDIKWRMPVIVKVGAVLLLAYSITIITNGFRIVSGYKIHLIVARILPASAQGLAHLVVGITIFLTVILVVYLTLERKAAYDRRN
ncbi:MAG: archaeosortase/exosortase family protein [Candidatus Omnitrophica bacterium]|nr:archaeosortase/exosortase family protein [Candidatus Omnitrophota bacterium]